MSIRETYDDPGNFTVDLKADTPPDVIDAISELDVLYVHAQGAKDGHLERFDDATLKANARYAGPIVGPIEYIDDEGPEGGVWRLKGHGMVWYLGDEERWPAPMKTLTFSAAAPAAVFDTFANDGIIPDNLTVGTITTSANTLTTTFQPDTRALDMFRVSTKALDMHYRVNPDGSVDASPTNDNNVYRTTEDASTKLAVAIPKSWGTGSDAIREGIETLRTRSRRDATNWASRSVIVDEAFDGSRSIAEFTDRDPNPYFGVNDTALVRNIFSTRPASDSGQSTEQFMTTLLEENDTEEGFDLDMAQWQLAYGQIAVGDFVWFWDPQAGIEDPDSDGIPFRGRRIYPKKIRITEADWPTVKGMGMYVRPGAASVTAADWIDLSPHVAWERIP